VTLPQHKEIQFLAYLFIQKFNTQASSNAGGFNNEAYKKLLDLGTIYSPSIPQLTNALMFQLLEPCSVCNRLCSFAWRNSMLISFKAASNDTTPITNA
jgi:hypothetical protein